MTDIAPPFISRQRIHFDMLDMLGVLHNAHYLLLFERARFDFWHAQGLQIGAPGLDWPYYVARNEINYRAPITRIQEVTVTLQVTHLGRSSATLGHAVYQDDGTLAAEGHTTLVRVDPKTRRAIPWSGEFRALLARYLIATER
ncbi:MAG: thioesterase family protein [Chloroherpetonaceae bacterium]|nr:acyl-CoA thioesterase [Chthonomonadaceae bacterium]MDW8208232.1 thioesterase family protein [Chloroherpetonaceae bacterium]